MAMFFFFGKYSLESAKGISVERTGKAENLMKKFGGDVKSVYALMGEKDLVIIADFPGIEEAMKASMAITKLTGISFSTSPAISVERFDKMVGDL